ncbi:MAG: hypothetical protein ACP5UM_01995 [Anaerolineae bacterium]
MPTLRPCGIRQLPAVYRLWGQGLVVDVQAGLPGGAMSFWPVLVAMLPGSSTLGENLFVLEGEDGPEAFVQARRRLERPEADLVYIAPALGRAPDAAAAWNALLTGTCLALGQQGVERIYASLPEDGPEVEAFQQAGFVLYTREELYCLDPGPRPHVAAETVPLVARSPEHQWALDRLYGELVPWLVQQAEGGGGFNGYGGLARPQAGMEHVLVQGGDVIGLIQLRPVGNAYHMAIILHPRAYHWARAVIAFGLGLFQDGPPRPVYCAVRHYQGGLRTPLEENGFRWVGTRALLVRHTTAKARVAPARRAEGTERQPEAAIPTALGFARLNLSSSPGGRGEACTGKTIL